MSYFSLLVWLARKIIQCCITQLITSYWFLTESDSLDGDKKQNPPGKKVSESAIHVHFIISNFFVCLCILKSYVKRYIQLSLSLSVCWWLIRFNYAIAWQALIIIVHLCIRVIIFLDAYCCCCFAFCFWFIISPWTHKKRTEMIGQGNLWGI